jgi:hypothetical protein
VSPREVSSDARLRLALLLAVLAGLGYYAVGHGPWSGGGGEDAVASSPCASAEIPQLATVSAPQLSDLQEELAARVARTERPDVYEQGRVGTDVAWSDNYPDGEIDWDPDATSPAGYEIRWWSAVANHGIDVWEFSDEGEAETYFRSASSTACRRSAVAQWALQPTGSRNVEWLNPEGVMQEDLFLLRGERVYRVAFVRKWAGPISTPAKRQERFSRLNRLGCVLFGCARESVALS